MKIRTYISIACLIVCLGIAAAFIKIQNQPQPCLDFNQGNIHIGATQFSIGIAATADQQAQGLGGCRAVPPHAGLYFPFKPPQKASFWMHGMVIPIDIIWIGEGKVIGIEQNVPPPADPSSTDIPIYNSPDSVTGVLEIQSGGAQQNNIQLGDAVTLTQ